MSRSLKGECDDRSLVLKAACEYTVEMQVKKRGVVYEEIYIYVK